MEKFYVFLLMLSKAYSFLNDITIFLTNQEAIQTFIQATIISTLNVIVAFIYVLMQYFNLNPIWVHIGQAGYQLIHCELAIHLEMTINEYS